jgi:hypothetical protein
LRLSDWYGIGPQQGPDLVVLPAGSEIQAANAEYIVRAVNAHADLLAACEAALRWHDIGEHCEAAECIRAALAKAVQS